MLYSYLVFIQLTIFKCRLPFRLKGDYDKTDEDVDHEEGNDDDVDEVEDGNDWTEIVLGADIGLVGID